MRATVKYIGDPTVLTIVLLLGYCRIVRDSSYLGVQRSWATLLMTYMGNVL